MAYKNKFPKMYIFTKCLQIKQIKKRQKSAKKSQQRLTIPTSDRGQNIQKEKTHTSYS